MGEHRANIDKWIEKLMSCKCLDEQEVVKLCGIAKQILSKELNVQPVCSSFL